MLKNIILSLTIFIVAAAAGFGLASNLSLGQNEPRPIESPLADRSQLSSSDATPSQATATTSKTSSGELSNERVQPRQVVNGSNGQKTIKANDETYPVRVYRPLELPNDPKASQWWVAPTQFEISWSQAPAEASTTLAIIDSGFALSHEEFTDRWYKNPGESGPATSEAASMLNCSDRGLALDASCNLIDDNRDGVVDNETGASSYENPSQLNCTAQARSLAKDCNLIDDDGNGFIDDVTGWDFMSFDKSVQAGELNPNGDGTTHGTMVAGVAAATGNNSKGIAGADWSTKILPIQALDDDSYGDTLSVADAIYYAIDQQADVISLSLGSDLPDDYVLGAVRAAIAQGIVVVAASGNDGCDCIVYPANYPEVLAVGALDQIGVPASFSSWGANLDILAPGTNMSSATWTATNSETAYVDGINGTSFATPLVGGLLTNIIRQQPEATPLQLVAALTETVNRTGLAQTTARSNTLGFGSLNAGAASQRLTQSNSAEMVYHFSPVSRGAHLDRNSPLEATGNYRVQKCTDDRPGSTPVFELTKSGTQFFTASRVEERVAVSQGYSSNLFAYSCLSQPHDQSKNIRSLDVYREFKNIGSKNKY